MSRNWGLVLLLLAVNVAVAGALAVPLSNRLEAELQNKDAGPAMTYGFDFNWWSEWHDRQQDWPGTFGPEIFGIGFAFRNLELLLKGALPAAIPGGREPNDPVFDPVLMEAGLLYILVQVFLTGGLLGVLRAPGGGWTVRALLHGSGFYFGRLLRLALVSLLVLWILFGLGGLLAGWIDHRAREAVSERTAMALTLGRNALMLLAVLFVSMVNGYAKATIAIEERASALLAWVSALSFCLRRFLRVAAHYALVAAAALVLLLVWHAIDGAWAPTGYKTQLLTLLLMEAFLFGRIFLRLALLGGQIAIYRSGT